LVYFGECLGISHGSWENRKMLSQENIKMFSYTLRTFANLI
jgi:hypothetical protein